MGKIQIVEVFTEEDIEDVVELASEIWRQHYSGIISEEQIDYMVAKYQSEGAIHVQMKEDGYHYYLMKYNDFPVGYLGIRLDENGDLFLSKLYIQENSRGRGMGRRFFQFIEDYAKEHQCKKVWLTVNRGNTESIQIYKKKKFVIVREEDASIGHGYMMNDYIMEFVVD